MDFVHFILWEKEIAYRVEFWRQLVQRWCSAIL